MLKEDSDALLGEFDLNGCEFDYVKFFKKFEKISNSSKKSLTTTSDNLNPVLRQLILKLRDQVNLLRVIYLFKVNLVSLVSK